MFIMGTSVGVNWLKMGPTCWSVDLPCGWQWVPLTFWKVLRSVGGWARWHHPIGRLANLPLGPLAHRWPPSGVPTCHVKCCPKLHTCLLSCGPKDPCAKCLNHWGQAHLEPRVGIYSLEYAMAHAMERSPWWAQTMVGRPGLWGPQGSFPSSLH